MAATEEKKYLVNVESNLDKYAKDAKKAAEEVDKLTAENIKLKGSTTASKEEIEKNNAKLRTAQKEYRDAKKMVDLQTQANKSEAGSRKQLSEILTLQMRELGKLGNAYAKDAQGVMRLNPLYTEQRNRIEATKKAIIDYDKALGDGHSSVGLYSEAIEKSAGMFSAIPGPIGRAGNAISQYGKILLLNPIVLVITAITAAVTGLVKVFKSTDSGATELAVRMEQLRAMTDKLRLSVVNLINWMKQQITAFKDWREEFEKNHKAISKVYEVITTIINPVKQLRFVINQVKDLLPETTTGFENLAQAARDYTEALDKLQDAENNYVSQSAENRNKIAKLEFTAQDATQSTERRRQALKDAMSIALNEVNQQKKFAQDKLDIEAGYLAEKSGLQSKDIINFIKMTDEEQFYAGAALKLARDNNEEKFKELEQYYADVLDLDTKYFEEQKRNISKLSGFENAAAKQELEALKLKATNEMQSLADLVNKKKDYELKVAEETGADKEKILMKYSAGEVEIAKMTNAAKLGLASNFASNLATIFGENTAIGKAAAIAETTINTYASATAAYKSLAGVPVVGPALGIAAAAAAVAAGIANVKKIISVKSGLPGDSGAGGMPTSITSTPAANRMFASQAPSTYLTQPQLSQSQLNAVPQNMLTASDIAAALSKMPAPIVSVEDINARSASKRRIEVRANI